MPKFFMPPEKLGDRTVLDGEDAHHLSRSLRARVGEKVVVADGVGNDHEYRVTAFTRDTVELERLSVRPSESEPAICVTLFIATAKGDKTETMIQKSVECGASHMVPFVSQNCVSRPEKGKKTERWNKIAHDAAGQCGRGRLPDVADVVSFDEAVWQAARIGGAILYEHAEEKFSTCIRRMLFEEKRTALAFLIGSEGGFTEKEVEKAREAGLYSLSLGPRILRCESVPGFLLGALFAAAEEI